MRRKPRSLFKARRRGPALYVGPEFVGPEPRYLPLLDALLRRHGPFRPGYHQVVTRHDDWCSIWSEGPCDCEPVVELLNPGRGGEEEWSN